MDNQSIEKSKSENSKIFSELKSLMNKTVKDDLKWYQGASMRYLLAHRISGIAVILLSASLPLITMLKDVNTYIDKDTLVSLVGVSIAFITGLKSFYRFSEVHIANMRGMVELKNYAADWDLAMIQAEHHPNAEEGLKIAMKATRTLLLKRDIVDRKNTEDYTQFYNVAEKKDSV